MSNKEEIKELVERGQATMLAFDECVVSRGLIMWNFKEAVELLQKLDPPLREVGWSVGLTGSVLMKGYSDEDLDLIVYPLDDGKIDRSLLYNVLNRFLKLQCDSIGVHRTWKNKGSSDRKLIEIWKTESKRVDVFILS